ncbi:hypothetical protein AALT_g11176 [Alternaria alternata]|nr:hypothetical protein AALT_g11176 [Alternaria alternata]
MKSHLFIMSLTQSKTSSSLGTQSSAVVHRVSPSNLSLHQFSAGSTVQDILATASLFHGSHIPVALFQAVFEQRLLSRAISKLTSRSLVRAPESENVFEVDQDVRRVVRSELKTLSDRSRHRALAIRLLDKAFPSCFSSPRLLSQSHELQMHVATIVDDAFEDVMDTTITQKAAQLAIRYCSYLSTLGYYALVAELATRFQIECRDNRIPLDTYTALEVQYATAQALRGRLDTALSLFRNIHRSRRHNLGRDDIRTAHSSNNLALAYQALGEYEKAHVFHCKALATKTTLLGEHHADTLVTVNNLGWVMLDQGHYDIAEDMFNRSLAGWVKVYDADDLFVITAKSNLGIALFFEGRLDEAEDLHAYAYNARRAIFGATHHETMKSKVNLAITINEKGYHERAEELYLGAVEVLENVMGASHPETLKTKFNLATALHDQRKFEDAEETIAEIIPLLQRKYGSSHPETLDAMEFLAILLQHLHNFSRALKVATKVYEYRAQKNGDYHDDTQRSLKHVRDLAEDLEESRTFHNYPILTPIAAC